MAGATAERLLEDDGQGNTDWKWPLVNIGIVIILLLIIVLLILKNYAVI